LPHRRGDLVEMGAFLVLSHLLLDFDG